MIPSVSMWSFDRLYQAGGFSQFDFLSWASAKHLSYVELLSYYMGEEKDKEGFFRKLEDSGLYVSCFTINSDFTQKNYHKSQQFQDDLDMAERLSAPYVRILTGEDKVFSNDTFKSIIEEITLAAEESEKRNITLVLENVGPYSGKTDLLLDIVKAAGSSHVRINFDTANSFLVHEDPLLSMDILKEYISYVHVKDFITAKNPHFDQYRNIDEQRMQISERGLLMTGIESGSGDVPVRKLIDKLKTDNYEGFVSVEYEGVGNCLTDTERSLDHLLGFIN